MKACSKEINDGIHARRDKRSEEHTSELQSPCNLVCRLLLENKKRAPRHRPVPLPRGPPPAGRVRGPAAKLPHLLSSRALPSVPAHAPQAAARLRAPL